MNTTQFKKVFQDLKKTFKKDDMNKVGEEITTNTGFRLKMYKDYDEGDEVIIECEEKSSGDNLQCFIRFSKNASVLDDQLDDLKRYLEHKSTDSSIRCNVGYINLPEYEGFLEPSGSIIDGQEEHIGRIFCEFSPYSASVSFDEPVKDITEKVNLLRDWVEGSGVTG